MSKKPEFDVAIVHKYYSAHCFNSAWDLIDKETRTDQENIQIISMSLTSLQHWNQQEDKADNNLSVGHR